MSRSPARSRCPTASTRRPDAEMAAASASASCCTVKRETAAAPKRSPTSRAKASGSAAICEATRWRVEVTGASPPHTTGLK
ncbi:MAG: hypothetical protein R3A52_20230 [Polyangiales bacterium]